MNNENNFNAYFLLSVIANLCQLADFDMNLRETKNDDLFNKIEEQTNVYLKHIIEQNDEIINLLKEK